MRHTLRNIPPELVEALEKRDQLERKSLNQVAVEALETFFGLAGEPAQCRDLSDIVGTWREDPALDAAIQEQKQVDADLSG